MLYYQGYTVSFQEVPDEVSLVILVADCPYRCPGCHSPQLRAAIGEDLEKDLGLMLAEYGDAITCVCFMGEGRDEDALRRCVDACHKAGLKVALYTGSNELWGLRFVDYLKIGPYIESLGGLDSPSTNQRMLRVNWFCDKLRLEDITPKFWRKELDACGREKEMEESV